MNPHLTINDTIEQRGFAMPTDRWFTIAELNNNNHDSRCWLHFTDLSRKHYTRDDGAFLVQSTEELYYFAWHRQEAS